MPKYNIAVLGCGAIFGRHLAAIKTNSTHYNLVGVFDPIKELQDKYAKDLAVKSYPNEDAVYNDDLVNCISILSPNNLHFTQAIKAIKAQKHVILEKPATFSSKDLEDIITAAKQNNVEVFCVLQVRLNPAIIITKMAYEQGFLGKIRSVSLVQRWQRPLDYFSGWRGSMQSGGGILREFAIHYLDAMQFILGQTPTVYAATFYHNKFKNTDVADSVYALFDFDNFGGTLEVSVASEPKNLECTLSIMCDNGFIKLGGKSLDEIIISDFLADKDKKAFLNITNQVLEKEIAAPVNLGASPYHPELYRQIIIDKDKFAITETINVIRLIEEIYAK